MDKCRNGHILEGKNVYTYFRENNLTIRCVLCNLLAQERRSRKKGILARGSIPEKELFESHFVKQDNCWLWNGSLDSAGYGQFRGYNNYLTQAHIYSYRLYIGEYDSINLELDHLCEVKRCINPIHLEPVTRAVNIQRRIINAKRRQFNSKLSEKDN
jgi:hypothetical protein